jgi:hypothetical protein
VLELNISSIRVKRSAGPYGIFNWTAEVTDLVGTSTIEPIEVHAASLHGEGACVEAIAIQAGELLQSSFVLACHEDHPGETTTLDVAASSSEIEAFCRDRCGLHVTATWSAAQPGNTFAWSVTFLAQDGDVPALFADDSTHALIGAGATVKVEERVRENTIWGDFSLQLCLFEGEVGMANVVNGSNTLEFAVGFVSATPVVGDMIEVGSQQLQVLEVHVNEPTRGDPSRVITDAAFVSTTSRVQISTCVQL